MLSLPTSERKLKVQTFKVTNMIGIEANQAVDIREEGS